MVKSKVDFHTKHESGFAPTQGCRLPFDTDLLEGEAKAREKLLGKQNAFLSKARRSAKDVDHLIEEMVAFEKIRSGHYWRDYRADLIARNVRSAVGKTGSLLDLGRLSQRPATSTVMIPRLDIPDLGPVPFGPVERGELQRIDLNTVDRGTYFDKWFNYNGRWTLTQLYDHAVTDPVPLSMDFVSANNLDPYDSDGLRATSETGIWFTYVPDMDGYVTVFWLSDRVTYRLFRQYYPRDADGWANGWLSVEGVVGIWTNNSFAGRDYVEISGSNGNAHDTLQASGVLFIHNSTYPVQAGKPVHVLIGTRSKVFSVCDGTGINLGAGVVARIDHPISIFTRAELEPYSPFY